MASQWIEPARCSTLVVLIESVAAPMLMRHSHPVCLELDIEPDLASPTESTVTAALLQSLINQALEEMPRGGDLTITACRTERGIELEIADTGREVESRLRTVPFAAAAANIDVVWKNCPQGGGSVTMTFPAPTDSLPRSMAA